jgi:hypothetical protein
MRSPVGEVMPRRGTRGCEGGGEDGWGVVPRRGLVARELATGGRGGGAAAVWMRGWMHGCKEEKRKKQRHAWGTDA